MPAQRGGLSAEACWVNGLVQADELGPEYAEAMLDEQMPNNQFQRSVNSRLRRLSPPAELERWASRAGNVRNRTGSDLVSVRS